MKLYSVWYLHVNWWMKERYMWGLKFLSWEPCGSIETIGMNDKQIMWAFRIIHILGFRLSIQQTGRV